MTERETIRSSSENAPGRPWAVVVLSDDLGRARQWVRMLAHEDLRFVCDSPQWHECIPGSWSTFDLVVLLLSRELISAIPPRYILYVRQRYMVVLEYAATGADRARWIENGADDCVSEPCDSQELLARLRASLRRQHPSHFSSHVLQVGPLRLWRRERTVTLDGRSLDLTTCEFALLATLAEHAGEVLGREALLEFCKGSAEQAFERSVDVQISRLRAKLGDNPRRPRLLKTVRGLGYILVAEPGATDAGTLSV
jgi:DNA-binding response OmpR family regulator